MEFGDLPGAQFAIPGLSKGVNRALSTYLDSLIHMFVMCQLHSAEQRLARVLVESAGQLGHAGPEGIEVRP